MWLNKIKIAIVEQNVETLEKLVYSIPKFSSLQETENAMYLLKEVVILLENLKKETTSSMKQIKKNIDFLKATQPQALNKLDIKS